MCTALTFPFIGTTESPTLAWTRAAQDLTRFGHLFMGVPTTLAMFPASTPIIARNIIESSSEDSVQCNVELWRPTGPGEPAKIRNVSVRSGPVCRQSWRYSAWGPWGDFDEVLAVVDDSSSASII